MYMKTNKMAKNIENIKKNFYLCNILVHCYVGCIYVLISKLNIFTWKKKSTKIIKSDKTMTSQSFEMYYY